MATRYPEGNSSWRWLVVASELLVLNLFVAAVWHVLGLHELDKTLLAWNVSYAFALVFVPPIVTHRSVRSEQIATAVLKEEACIIIIFYALLSGLRIAKMWFVYYVLFAVVLFVLMLLLRLAWYTLIRRWRLTGNDTIRAVFVGAGGGLVALYDEMTDDVSKGYDVVGYFDDDAAHAFGDTLPRLGAVGDVVGWLATHNVHALYCSLPPRRNDEIQAIISFCENNLVHFYAVPNVRNYVHHKMSVQFIGNSVVLTLRDEPLASLQARFVKRAFDILFSLLVIVLLLWWVTLLVAIITKITMPGPVFFRQQRNGQDNKAFCCYKFRTMVVNAAADEQQATKGDSRITRWGQFMRRTNIDELPQFVNVFLGDMSVVGPRPHMIKHNEEYKQLIDKYMVRSYCRSGITGWAQVTGSRGETKTLADMEQRIRKDIWYIENWTFMLDLRIILLTIYNMLGGEKGNAY